MKIFFIVFGLLLFGCGYDDKVRKEQILHSSNLFLSPKPFENKLKGAVILISTVGKVKVVHPSTFFNSEEKKPFERNAIVGESLPVGSTIRTYEGAESALLFTNGTLAKLNANSKLVINSFWQKNFYPSEKRLIDIVEETSSSRIGLELETGDLVVDVKKLKKDSSFVIESSLGFAGIRGTQFRFSADSSSLELAVLEGEVAFLDANQKVKSVGTAQMLEGSEKGVDNLFTLPGTLSGDLTKDVAELRRLAENYDLKRLANIIDGYASKPNYIVKSALNMELIWCPPGSFIMGDDQNEIKNYELEPHPVIITKGFYLGKYEVTQEEYKKVMGKNPSKFKGAKRPVEHVSWKDATEFCEILSKKEQSLKGWKFVLPTEAQWEYSCQAGTKTKYSWGDYESTGLANYKDSGLQKTSIVGSYSSNPWGFYDMHGNTWEWCSDWYSVYSAGILTNPIGPASGLTRVIRGGSWAREGKALHSAERGSYIPNARSASIGFRVSLQKFNELD